MKEEFVIIILYPGCISFEITLASELLSAKYKLVTVSPDGQDVAMNSGVPIKVNKSFQEMNLFNCKAILVPGGDPRSLMGNLEIDRILIDANRKNILIAGICAGPSVLAKAGILKGKRVAHGYQKEQLDFLKDIFKGVLLTDDLFVADGNIITAKPEAHIDFAVEIACRLDAVDAPKSGRLKEYYRGTLGRKIRPSALAKIENEKGQFLLFRAVDNSKNEVFYRPVGGGIEFQETGREAVEREILEELGLKLIVGDQVNVFENIFTYEGHKGHEIIFLFEARFEDQNVYNKNELDIVESGKVIGKAVWRSLKEIEAEGAKVYSLGVK
jgi:putative intracellular protease/amidase/ADP-ribose pyrophosphatase YjhB (NUDIX family)